MRPASAVWATAARSESGAAFGDPASAGTNDSVVALVGAYGKTQTVTATLRRGATTGGEEAEIHVRLSFNATQIFSYEIDIVGSSVVIVKWTGNQGSIFNLPYTNGTNGFCVGNVIPVNGDVFVVAITGDATLSTITVRQNGTLIAQADDSAAISGTAAYIVGNPGLGWDVGASGSYNQLGWDSFRVVTSP